jgi:hypothetical protein
VLLTLSGAAQEALVPPLEPVQFHDHGPEPVTDEAVPVEQRLVEGAALTATPFADPQVPFTAVGVLDAEQLAVVPLLEPVQDHVHGPEPVTLDAVPAVQRLVVGTVLTVVPLAEPQVPFTAAPLPLIVTVAVLVPSVAPLADERVIVKVLDPVNGVALLIATVKVLAVVSEAVQFSVPLAAVYCDPAVAVPFEVA